MQDGINVQVFLRNEDGTIGAPKGFNNAFIFGKHSNETISIIQNGEFSVADILEYFDVLETVKERLVQCLSEFEALLPDM